MALVQYTAEVRGGLLLELPAEAEELQLKPGDRVRVRLNRKVKVLPKARSEKNGGKPGGSGGDAVQKKLSGRGMLAGVISSEDFMRRKREETASEDRPIR